MVQFDSIKQSTILVFDKLTKFKVFKYSAILAISTYIIFFSLSFLVTISLGNLNYNPIDNFISEMGQLKYSPAPFLFDLACILSGFLSFPITLYISKVFFRAQNNNEVIQNHRKTYLFLIITAFITGIIGDFGFVGVGVFSLDRNIWNLHFLSASFVFVGYTLSAFLIGFVILAFRLKLSKYIAISGILYSITILFTALFLYMFFNTLFAIFEWVMTISMNIWLYLFIFNLIFKKSL